MNPTRPQLTPEVLVPRLGDYLVEKGLLSAQDLGRALARQQAARTAGSYPPHLGQILVELKLIDQAVLDQAITEQIIQLREALQRANAQLEQRVQERTAELEQALEKLHELNQVKSNFVANISHELRTPLTHIKGYIELFLTDTFGALSAEQRESMQIMESSTNRLEQLIEDLILFSTSERGQFSVRQYPFFLQDILKDVQARAASRAEEHRVSFSLNVPPRLPAVNADPEKISWVLLQLLDNAIKFTGPGGKVSLALENSGKLVQISVSDTGIGIPSEKLGEIFEPFHQLDSSSTRRYGGTGLGLNLVRKIVEAHGSTIHVTSKVGAGSRFYFSLNSVEKV